VKVAHDALAAAQQPPATDVTARHYNRHDYLEEKSAALTAWGRHVAALVSDTAEGGTVVTVKVRQKGSWHYFGIFSGTGGFLGFPRASLRDS
jgi:hypothetical protein